MPQPNLHLPDRTGIPDSVAYLRATHPAPSWSMHRNYGELSSFWLHVHASLREQAGQLRRVTHGFREKYADQAGFQQAFVPRFNQFLQHLNGHHQIEDSAYFPRFRALDPRMVAGFDLLEHDHEIIHAALLESIEHARALIAALGQGGGQGTDARRVATDRYVATGDRLHALLGRHLADEEELVLPAMLEHGERSVT